MKKLLFALLLTTAALLTAAEIKVAENGKACAGILIPSNAKPIVKLAASELADYLKKITGADFKVSDKSTFKNNFKLGFCKPQEVKGIDFLIRTTGSSIDICGTDTDSKQTGWFYYYYDCDDKGTLQGVYFFLEKLGVRWPTPGDEHIPVQKTLIVKDLNIRFKSELPFRQAPTCPYKFANFPDSREYCGSGVLFMRWLVRLGGSTRSFVAGVHSETPLGFYRDPKWTAEKSRLQMTQKGTRNKNYTCWSDPDVTAAWTRAADGYFSGLTPAQSGLKHAAPGYLHSSWPFPFFVKDEFMIEPKDNDGSNSGICHCKRCLDLRKKYPCKDQSEIMWRMLADVAKNIKGKHPDKYITTLIYPPKEELPSFDLPDNIKVKVCISGPKQILSPKSFKNDMQKLRDWRKKTGHGVSLYTYHCVCHGNRMPDLVEYYPSLLKKYAQSIRGLAPGMFMETKDSNFTRMMPDVYFFHRFMREPDLDLDKELDEYFRLLYGPGHKEGKIFWQSLEKAFIDFWKKTIKDNGNVGKVSPWDRTNVKESRRKVWELVYTEKFLADQGKLLAEMQKKCKGTKYAKNVRLLKKYIYDDLVYERNLEFNRDAVRNNLVITGKKVKALPTAAQWRKITVHKMRPMKKFVEHLRAGGNFRIAASDKNIFLRADFAERFMNTRRNRVRRSGNGAVWKDDCAELYFYSKNTNVLWHILINSRGAWASRWFDAKKGEWFWKMIPGASIKVIQNKRSWQLNCTIPLKEIAPKGGAMKFNILRERRNRKLRAAEQSTWSPLVDHFNRRDFINFAHLVFK